MNTAKTIQERTVEFFKTVEAGDIALLSTFQEAIAMFGYTQLGKTSSCHILANSPLKSVQVNGRLMYKCTNNTSKYYSAKIGGQGNSVTQIPNIFDIQFRLPNNDLIKFALLDQPGYGDSFGFHRVLSNGYFHYRTFSKTPKLKFIVAIDRKQFEGVATVFKNTIQYFLNSFKNYKEISSQILNATVILITQVQPKTKLQDIKNIIKAIQTSNLQSEAQSQKRYNFQQFVDFMIKNNNKIYMIQKPQRKDQVVAQCKIIQQIYKNTKYWQRQTKNNILDMTHINFSVAEQIIHYLNNPRQKKIYLQTYIYFTKYMQQKIRNMIIDQPCSLLNVVNQLSRDCVNGIQNHQFLNKMQQFKKQYYLFNPIYKQKRQRAQINLFKSNDQSIVSNSKISAIQIQKEQRQQKSVYFIKKFNLLNFIVTKSKYICSIGAQSYYNISQLQYFSSIFIQIFQKFSTLKVQKSDTINIIYKYSYIIQRLIQESKIITLILFLQQQNRYFFVQHCEGFVQIVRTLIDKFFTQCANLDVDQFKQQFIQNVNFNQLQVVSQEIVEFFESVQSIKSLPQNQMSMAKLLLKYSQLLSIRGRNTQDNQKFYVAYKLFLYRVDFYCYLQKNLANLKKDQKQKWIQIIFSLSNSLASLLISLGYSNEGIQVYKSINDAESVLRSYQIAIKSIESKDQAQLRQKWLKYGKQAQYFHRKQLALKCYQQAYSRSKIYKDIVQVSQIMIELQYNKQMIENQKHNNLISMKIGNKNKQDQYLKNLRRQIFCEQFSKQLTITISNFKTMF